MRLNVGILLAILCSLSTASAVQFNQYQYTRSSTPKAPKTYTINLDLPPQQRWVAIAKDFATTIQQTKVLFPFPEKYRGIVDTIATMADKVFGEPGLEMAGLAQAAGVSVGDIVMMNLMYETSDGCTSIIARNNTGHIMHGRNLDAIPIQGPHTQVLRDLEIGVEVQSKNTTLFRGTTWAGFVGILTGERVTGESGLTASINARWANPDSLWESLFDALFKGGQLNSLLVRDLLSDPSLSYKAALAKAQATPLITPVYVVLGTTNDGCVISRNRTFTADTWCLSTSPDRWYLVQENWDHWKPPPTGDPRRVAVEKMMNATTPAGITRDKLMSVLQTPPVLNSWSLYTVVMCLECDSYQTAYYQQTPVNASQNIEVDWPIKRPQFK